MLKSDYVWETQIVSLPREGEMSPLTVVMKEKAVVTIKNGENTVLIFNW